MEFFAATDNDTWTIIKSVIDESDYYLLVIGGKCGSLPRRTRDIASSRITAQ